MNENKKNIIYFNVLIIIKKKVLDTLSEALLNSQIMMNDGKKKHKAIIL